MACAGDQLELENGVIPVYTSIVMYLNDQKQHNPATVTELLRNENGLGELVLGMYSEEFSEVLPQNRQKVVEYFHQHPRMATEIAKAQDPSSDTDTSKGGASIEELTDLTYKPELIHK